MFSPDNHKQLEASFNEFCKRPENAASVEKAQRQEMKRSLKLKAALQWLEFEKKLAATSPAAQEALAPFLKHGVLRRIIQTFGNSSSSSSSLPQAEQQGAASQHSGGAEREGAAELEQWASNARVLALLRHAKELLETGSMSEQQLEHHLLQQLKDPKSSAKQEFEAVSSCSVVTPPHMLVSALNEQLEERRKGNAAYKAGDLSSALKGYSRALAIVEFVRGGSAEDQAEVDRNKVTVLLNMAAVLLALSDFGAASLRCSQVLQLDPGNSTALLRRAKAYAMRREFQEAEKDMRAIEALGDGCAHALDEVDELRERMKAMQLQDSKVDKSFYGKMFAAHR